MRNDGMLVMPEALVIWHRDADVLLDGDRTQRAFVTMLPPIRFLEIDAAILHFLTNLALDFCRRFAYDALVRTVRFEQLTLHGLHRLGRRRTQPSIIELALELELPVIEQDSASQRTPHRRFQRCTVAPLR